MGNLSLSRFVPRPHLCSGGFLAVFLPTVEMGSGGLEPGVDPSLESRRRFWNTLLGGSPDGRLVPAFGDSLQVIGSYYGLYLSYRGAPSLVSAGVLVIRSKSLFFTLDFPVWLSCFRIFFQRDQFEHGADHAFYFFLDSLGLLGW